MHILAATIFTWQGLKGNASVGEMFEGLYAESEIDYTTVEYPPDTNRLIIQHGMNLGIAGVMSLLAIIPMFYRWQSAPIYAFIVFCYDVGFFFGPDVAALAHPLAKIQTFIVSIGLIASSIYTYNNSEGEEYDMYFPAFASMSGFMLIMCSSVFWFFEMIGLPIFGKSQEDPFG